MHKTLEFTYKKQCQIYNKLNDFSYHHKYLGRLGAIPVVTLETISDIVKYPLAAIEQIARATLNFLGAAFSKKYTIKNAITSLETFLACIAVTPAALVVSPFKLVYQTIAILRDPTTLRPFSYNPDMQKPVREPSADEVSSDEEL